MASPLHNVARWLARHAAIAPDRPAVVDADRSLDYAALEDRSARCAAWLAEMGVTRGDRVALLLGNRSAYLELVFAAARLGAIAVPLNTRLVAREITQLLDDCTPRVLVYEHALADEVDAVCARSASPPPVRLGCGRAPCAYERQLARHAPRPEIAPVTPDAPMLLMYTSGTTGAPKGALLPHRKTLYNSLNAQIFFDLTRDDRVLAVVPLFHSFGLCILSIPALYAGACVILQPRFDAEAVWRAVDEQRVSYFGGVPTMFQALLDALENGPARCAKRDSLRFLFTAGAAIAPDLIRAFERRGLVLKQGFGQTETSILCCLDARDALRKAGSVGRPVFHADVRVVERSSLAQDPTAWRDVSVGETGEIVVRGPINFLGYWKRPEATAETLRGEWLRTGDLATVDAEGFLTLVGRARDMYISGGENVYPAEVETVYAAHPDVREIAVLGVPNARWGEVGHAFVVLRDGAVLDAPALRDWGAERLAGFKLPRNFTRVAELPRTASGKVQKHRLPGGTANGTAETPAGNPGRR